MTIEYDLQEHPLQIKTDSAVGSGEKVIVQLYTAEEVLISSILLNFSATPQHYISYCTSSSSFPVDLPEEQNKTWTITKTATALKIECNDAEVLNLVYSESNYDSSSCVTRYSWDVEKIKFTSSDTASDEYRQEPASLLFILLLSYCTQ